MPISRSLREEINLAIKKLGKPQPYVNFNLYLSEDQVRELKDFNIEVAKEYNKFGQLENLIAELTLFTQSLGNNLPRKVEIITYIVNKVINEIVLECGNETAWVSLRTFTDTNEFDVPRWHTDGYYFKPYSGKPYKVCLCLKGAATLFCPLQSELRKEFNFLQRTQNRQALASLLSFQPRESAKTNQGTLFIVGDANSSAVHSEPPIKQPRLFLSILPGSKDQISELKDRWGS